MKIALTNKTVFITGGSKGIGKAIAELLASCGANVAIMARGREELEMTVATINARDGGRALALVGDVSNYHDIGRAVSHTVEQFGGLQLAVNNAGVAGAPGLLHDTRRDNWRNVMGINLDGVAYAMMFEVDEMLKAGGGAIVNIASVEAHTILKGFTAYSASKHALLGLTKGAAADYAEHGIRINSVSPGVIRTPLTMADGQKDVTERLAGRIPVGRLGEAEEIASAVAFLLSDHAGYATGTDLVVDGGFLLRE